VDVATNFHLTPRQDLLVGYSKLYGGDFWQYSLRW
jgi:hypothetical protein